MKKIEPYIKYKHSGIAWLGEIPEHWEIRRIKYIFKEQDQRSETGLEDLLSVSHYTGVTKKSDRVNSGELLSNAATLVGYKIVKRNDLVMNIMLAWNGSLGISKYDGITSPAYCVFKSLIGGEKYFGYLYRTKEAQQEFKKQSTGIIDSRLRLYPDKFFNIKTTIPSKNEQTSIANFLDYKTAKIDRFIRKKKQLIKLLNQQKSAIINQAVTKGLDPNVKMKEIDLDWLGDIPAHWEVRKLKYVANFQSGEMITSESIDSKEGEYPVFGGGGFRGYTTNYTNEGNYILIGRQGALCGNIKYANGKFWASEHAIVTYPKIEIETIYLGEVLKISNLGKLSQTAAQPGIAIGQIKNVSIPIPPLPEQNIIVSHIEKETAKLNQTITTIEKEITLVQEYRTTLIAEAVTGKIDVRGYEIPEVEETESYEEMEEELSMVTEDFVDYETEEME